MFLFGGGGVGGVLWEGVWVPHAASVALAFVPVLGHRTVPNTSEKGSPGARTWECGCLGIWSAARMTSGTLVPYCQLSGHVSF